MTEESALARQMQSIMFLEHKGLRKYSPTEHFPHFFA